MTTTRRTTRTPRSKPPVRITPGPETVTAAPEVTATVNVTPALLKPPLYTGGPVGRVSAVAWWCPECDNSQTLKFIKCAKCGTPRPKESA